MTRISFRKMAAEDLVGVALLERLSFQSPWPIQSFVEELDNPVAYYLLAVDGETVVGYAGAWIIVDEAHITNVAVLEAYQRQGLGVRMMREMMQVSKRRGARSMTLEVRTSNMAALALYQKLGFVSAGIRKNYYEDTQEDAMIMWLKTL